MTAVAEAIVERLEAHGVRHVFGIPGTHNLPLYHHLARSSIEHVLPRHEQGAGYAADGYARSGGGAGVCVATSGPGVLNLASAIGTAHADSIPLLAIAPGMSASVAGRDTGHLHEARDQLAAMAGVAETATRVDSAAAAADAIDGAFGRFASARPRPAYIEIPLDAMEATGPAPGPVPDSPPVPSPGATALDTSAAMLADAGRVAIVLGGGAVDAGDEALALARALDAPVITTANGKGAVPESDPLALGASIRLRSAQRFLADCDVVLAVGTELAESDLWEEPPLALNGRLIRVDIDPDQAEKNAPAAVALIGDSALTLRAILERCPRPAPRGRGRAYAASLRELFREESLVQARGHEPLIAALDDALGESSIVAGDSTMACYYGAVHLLPRDEARRFLYPCGFAPLGYAIPAAIGAKLAHPDLDVLALIGDGGAMFTLPELAVAAERELPIVVVVVNDGGYGEIRREMEERGQPPLGVDLMSPDFAALARALGARGERVGDAASLAPLLTSALEDTAPTLIEVALA